MLTRLRRLPKKTKQVLQATSFIVPWAIVAGLMIHGSRKWPNSPIREINGRYMDKVGTLVSQETYSDFSRWQSTLFIGFAAVFFSVFIVSWLIDLPIPIRRVSNKKPF